MAGNTKIGRSSICKWVTLAIVMFIFWALETNFASHASPTSLASESFRQEIIARSSTAPAPVPAPDLNCDADAGTVELRAPLSAYQIPGYTSSDLRAAINIQNFHRLHDLVCKLSSGKPINILIVGGSHTITDWLNLDSKGVDEFGYPGLLERWLNRAHPLAGKERHTVTIVAAGGRDACYWSQNYENKIRNHLDLKASVPTALVLFECGINDGAMRFVQASGCIEALARKTLAAHVSVVFLDILSSSPNSMKAFDATAYCSKNMSAAQTLKFAASEALGFDTPGRNHRPAYDCYGLPNIAMHVLRQQYHNLSLPGSGFVLNHLNYSGLVLTAALITEMIIVAQESIRDLPDINPRKIVAPHYFYTGQDTENSKPIFMSKSGAAYPPLWTIEAMDSKIDTIKLFELTGLTSNHSYGGYCQSFCPHNESTWKLCNNPFKMVCRPRGFHWQSSMPLQRCPSEKQLLDLLSLGTAKRQADDKSNVLTFHFKKVSLMENFILSLSHIHGVGFGSFAVQTRVLNDSGNVLLSKTLFLDSGWEFKKRTVARSDVVVQGEKGWYDYLKADQLFDIVVDILPCQVKGNASSKVHGIESKKLQVVGFSLHES
jgi:hypothetical protein